MNQKEFDFVEDTFEIEQILAAMGWFVPLAVETLARNSYLLYINKYNKNY